MFKRYYSDKIHSWLKPNKVLVLYGPRQVGKTTIIQNYLKQYKGKVYQSTGEDAGLKEILESNDFSKIISFFTGYDLIFIDEAQKIEHIGQGLKIIVDQIPKIRVIATGSSSFDLSNKIGEPLVGRQTVHTLFPISVLELKEEKGGAFLYQNLERLLIFGQYPEVLTSKNFADKIQYLFQIRDAYLYKDILELEQIRNSQKILQLLRLIAFQIGHEVSLQELGRQLGMSRNTVERYLDLLEKAFVIIRVGGFSRNLRKEITKISRYYFYDNGIRNALIGNFNFLNSRNDIGQLWENFLFIERMKKREYLGLYANYYFWRTWSQQEIDLVEERGGKLYGYEFKWQNHRNHNAPKEWLSEYQEASYDIIDQTNYLDFVS
ncbi:MAG: hypothetical protein A2233_01400 [Candidatus Kerfeldbacteria bacterium RIFOXYA2_FULL_38_24]|uniref:AAA+ ATPase domain-containing protein n=1 Tax=Candidatus Kerfeldbacteria bacterium RIFOXYB2_FULL_38_14 TaxID=1798547 RepID=A0A1G2BGI1_9BACT|nr:MAG: hypothetical protein A2233_01400 [Candidatus Kerfeldbacteria bacterium RIFOXYA2_FULL_38_24]OGY87390.1 MAG: hypothetical protein A2319_05490 [Candidatus Kerfeldbacteria bacterium RIFOXYB2_FULL_38_14]OGY90341.1 MAG: hypothetical protein A2458_04395 [Candidatus Kerfeldbacteria bacterium RIFOXYC2_FULL_38_9]